MKKDKTGCDGKTCMLCRWAAREWKLTTDLHRKNFLIKKGQTFFNEGDPVQGIFFVYEGLVKVHKHWGEDKELIIRFAQKGDIVGHRGIGGKLPVFPITATALTNTQVCYVDIDFFTSSLKVNQDLLYKLLYFFAEELQTTERQMRNLAHMSVKERLATALLNLQNQFGCNDDGLIKVQLSKQDLASYIGATYETTFRILSELVAEKLVGVTGKNYTIMNTAKLLELAGP